jgi:F-box-like
VLPLEEFRLLVHSQDPAVPGIILGAFRTCTVYKSWFSFRKDLDGLNPLLIGSFFTVSARWDDIDIPFCRITTISLPYSCMQSMSPIPSLPTEIVIKILSIALRRAIDDKEPTTTSLLNFCLVSRRWRDVVQTASELWTVSSSLPFPWFSPTDKDRSFLQYIDLHWPIEQQRTWVEQSAPRGIDVHALMEPEDHFEIIKHPSRLRSLRLLSVPLGYLEQFLGSIEGSKLDKLESIHLGCDACSTGMAIYELPPDFPARTPCLSAISLSALRIANLHIVAHQLTHLEIFRSTHTSEDLMLTLSLCVNLEYLSLGGLSVHGPYKQGPVIMPRLRTLLLHPYNTTYCVQLILGISRFGAPARHLRAPQLLCFYLWFNGECDVHFTDAISDFVSGFLPVLVFVPLSFHLCVLDQRESSFKYFGDSGSRPDSSAREFGRHGMPSDTTCGTSIVF